MYEKPTFFGNGKCKLSYRGISYFNKHIESYADLKGSNNEKNYITTDSIGMLR
jgi:hypothetical protein